MKAAKRKKEIYIYPFDDDDNLIYKFEIL